MHQRRLLARALLPPPGMGIEKPYEVETHALGAPPPRHDPMPLEERIAQLIRVEDGGVRIADQLFGVTHTDAGPTVEELRDLVLRRFRQRRPHADEATWRSFSKTLPGALAGHRWIDRELRRRIVLTIDGL